MHSLNECVGLIHQRSLLAVKREWGGAYLLQHVFGKVLLLVHGQNGSLHLLVGEFKPAAQRDVLLSMVFSSYRIENTLFIHVLPKAR